jgi:hypothetical protein
MNLRFAIVEKMLQRARSRWKWGRVLYRTFLIGCILCGLALLFNLAVHRRLVSGKAEAMAICLMLVGAGAIAWFILMITALASKAERGWLAAKLERIDRRFLDRLNTLLFLENRRADPKAGSFAIKIAQQTKQTFGSEQPRSPFSLKSAAVIFAVFIVLLAITVGVYHRYSPWPQLAVADRARSTASQETRNLELAPPATNNIEENKNWGEVRITDPGCDLKVTKVDVVPLEIEAAANEALNRVAWFSAINGAQEMPHELPPPAEPRYAAYQPTLYLDELQLSDWDLMTYYAKANTEKDNSFASEVYFLEVRPFREDILKLPGGEGGKAYKALNEMTALINRQQHVIRQTHQHIQKPPPQENLQAQDRKKLSDAESDLGDSTSHLYAEMASKMENAPIGVALDNLAKAAHSLDNASDLLKDNAMKEAPGRERDALTELVAARKMFQKAVSENPGAFGDQDQSGEDEPIKLAIDENKKLEKMAEFRNEARAGRDFIQKSLDEQRRIEQGARSRTNRLGGIKNDLPGLSARERQLEQSLRDFQQQHPNLFKDSGQEFDKARQSMEKAANEMQKQSSNSQSAAAQATKDLQNLSSSMNGGSATQQLADAYRLKQMLDNDIGKLDDFSGAASNNIPKIDPAQTARDARETVNQLKAAAEQEPTRDAFGQPLREALSGTNKVNIDAKLAQLEQAQDQPAQQQLAGEARDELSRVSKAFGESEPKSLQMARKSDSLKPDAKDSFNLGLSQLDSLAKQLGKDQKVSPQAQGKQGREALYNLQTGMRSFNGDNDRGNQIMLHLEDMLKSKDPIEVEDLRKLLSELHHFSIESSDHLAKRDDPEVTNIDPAKLPPAYRGRIQKYFQKLSEK